MTNQELRELARAANDRGYVQCTNRLPRAVKAMTFTRHQIVEALTDQRAQIQEGLAARSSEIYLGAFAVLAGDDRIETWISVDKSDREFCGAITFSITRDGLKVLKIDFAGYPQFIDEFARFAQAVEILEDAMYEIVALFSEATQTNQPEKAGK